LRDFPKFDGGGKKGKKPSFVDYCCPLGGDSLWLEEALTLSGQP